jgi:hypothetical protein
MKKGTVYLLVGLTSLVCSAYAQSSSFLVTGIVFLDKNENGKQERGEKGLYQIPVSNGETIVLTDKDGRYSLQVDPDGSVFPILPSDFSVSNPIRNAAFRFLPSADTTSRTLTVDIPLVAQPVKTSFKVAVVGDVQVDNEQEIQYTNQTLMPDLMGRSDADFGVVMGDLVNDKPALLPVVKSMISTLPMPSWIVCGNHDRLTKTLLSPTFAFDQQFGASTYAFNYGGVHFIVLNNVYPKGKAGYEALVSSKQLTFLANDLKIVNHKQQVVVMMHIPLAFTQNKEVVLNLLDPFDRALILSAHLHAIERFFHKTAHQLIPEWGVGATCGGWWTGERDVEGVPSGLMSCGSPRNYFMLDFTPHRYRMTYKGVGLDPAYQMDIWINGQDTLDAHVDALSALPPNALVVNVFGGSDSTVVWMSIDHQAPIRMEKASLVSPNVSRVVSLVRSGVYPSLHSQHAALRKTVSPHVWQALLPENLAPGIHMVQIEGKDAYGLEVHGSRAFTVFNP